MLRLNLTIEAPDHPAPRQVVIERFPCRLGRALENDLPLPFVSVSGRHLQIERQGSAQVLLTDLGSTNGTRIGEHQLLPHQPESVTLPCRLRLGDVFLELASPESEDIAFTFAQSSTELRELVSTAVCENTDDDSRPFFEVLSGPDSGKRFFLSPDGRNVQIGTTTAQDICLKLAGLPDLLATLQWEQAQCWFVPEGNFFSIQGHPLTERHLLQSGERFIIGHMELLYFDPLESVLVTMDSSTHQVREEAQLPDADALTPPGDEQNSLAEPSEPDTDTLPPEPLVKVQETQEAAPKRGLGALEIGLLLMSLLFLLGTLGLLAFFFLL